MTTQYSGSGDPARSLALLWRTRQHTGRAGGPTVDRIVRAAIELADADGLASLSMRKVADRLGVGAMSLYTYVPGKAELLDVMLDTVYGETLDQGEAVDGEGADPGAATSEATDRADGDGGDATDWRFRLTQIARANWALYHHHPWLLQVAVSRPPLGPNVTAKYERELAAVEGLGLTDVEMDAIVTLVNGHVHGAARGAVEAAQAAGQTGMTDEQWWGSYAPLLDKVLDARRFPLASRVGAAVGAQFQAAYAAEHAFEFGLARILDGIEALLRARHA